MSLPEPNFIDRDPQAITEEMIAAWETMAGKPLHPAQVERLQIDQHVYRETLVRIGIQEAAKQNLLAFATAPILDYLGQLVDTHRLPAQAASTTVRLILAEPASIAFQIPAGFRVETSTGVQFAATAATDIAVGQAAAEFLATAVVTGAAANGYVPGQVSVLVDELPVDVQTVENLTPTRGGMDAEDDERYRARIKLAPERFSWGSENRYRSLAMTAAAELIDVQVVSPAPDGRIDIILLASDGVASTETIARVTAALSDRRNRMMNDRITVKPATPVDYDLVVEIDVLASHVADPVLSTVRARLLAWADAKSRQLGGDLVPAQVKTALGGIAGLYDVRVLQPSAKRVLEMTEWPRLGELTVTLGRTVDDV